MVKVAAYQAPYRPFPAAGGAERAGAWLTEAQHEGVQLLCCLEALIGELANESDGDLPATASLEMFEKICTQ
jgi:hypothetical protein